jgi:glycosyltransferase involved in cell wall biosynthesis
MTSRRSPFRTGKRSRPKPAPLLLTVPAGPLVSIVICAHDDERFLSAAIDSALAQTDVPVEVIVIDDGSTDGSRALIAGYGVRIRTVFKRHGGQPSAINAGFHESRGDIVCLLDARDVFAPGKAARLVEIFERNPEAGWVFHELGYIDAHGKNLPLDALPDRNHIRAVLRRRRRYSAFAHLDLRYRLAAGERLTYACPAFSALSFRRQTLEAILPMPEDIARAGDEFPKFAALALFPGIHLGECLAQQRVGDGAAPLRDQEADAAARFLKTAYYLRYRYRHLSPSTDKWFASSFGRLLGVMGPRATLRSVEAQRYLKDYFGPFTWMRQGPRIAYHAARGRLSGPAQPQR